RQPELLLCVAREIRHRDALERRRQDRHRDREVAPGELLRDERARQRAACAAAAEALVDAARDESERVRLGRQLLGQLRGLVALARARSYLVPCELTHRLDDELLLFAGIEVDHGVLRRAPTGARAPRAQTICAKSLTKKRERVYQLEAF